MADGGLLEQGLTHAISSALVAAATSMASVPLRWWLAVVAQKSFSTCTSRAVISSSRSGSRWWATSRHASTISAVTNWESVPPQSNTTARTVTTGDRTRRPPE
ncbi:MAG TPA: hypothetical protein VF045_12025 [Acidimicrobiales bacterium]